MSKKQHRILLVDDNETVLFSYRQSLTNSGHLVAEASNLVDAKLAATSDDFDAIILDLTLPDGNSLEWIPELRITHPDTQIIVVTANGDLSTAVKAIKSGAENYLAKPVDFDTLEMALRTALELGDLRRERRIKRRLDKIVEPFFGADPAIQGLKESFNIAAANDTIILLLGETGTGKGVLARWIHENSARAHGAFVELNCSCIKGDLLRSELFGHVKGSFTSAVSDREGLLEMANGGTLFLDEIGDMDAGVQAQLLKTLEERTYRRVGENRVRKSDFRLICATNKDLLKQIGQETFRQDLYYRICVFPLTIPPLRQRSDDLDELVRYFLAQFDRTTVEISAEVLAILKNYQWPGNIRELRNILERAILLARNNPLTPDCFPGLVAAPEPVAILPKIPVSLEEKEREYLRKVVDSCDGDKKKACEMLGISIATIYRKLKPENSTS